MPNALIDVSSSGNNTIVAADSTGGFKITAFSLSAAGSVKATLLLGATSVWAGQFVAGSSVVIPETALSQWVGAANAAIVLNLGGAVAVSGHVAYQKV